MDMQTSEHKGWESVTDVPCPGCQVGIVRWAEAGFVPGWRECDTCGRQFMGDPATGDLNEQRAPTHGVSPERIAEVRDRRSKVAEATTKQECEFAVKVAHENLRGSFLGQEWHIIGGTYLEGEARTAYLTAWSAGAAAPAIAALKKLPADMFLPGQGTGEYGIPFRPRVMGISRDGQRVHVYRDGSGGTYQQSIEDALAGRVVNA